MARLYRIARMLILVICVLAGGYESFFNPLPVCFGGAPSYELQTAPANGVVTIEHRPMIRWQVFPNGNRIREAKLMLDGQTVPLQQITSDDMVALVYQPTADLKPGNHTLVYSLDIAGFQPIVLSSAFIVTDKGPDLYDGKDQVQLAAMESQAITVLNGYRQAVGLSPLVQNQKLSMSAQAHANYQEFNNVQSHYEQLGDPGFTGVKPQNRAEFFGYIGYVAEGISFDPPIDSLGIDGLMDAPYHRLGHINPNFREVGIAFGWKPEQTIVNYGTTGEISDERVMLYPYPGQLDAKIAWFAIERPNPLASYGQDKVTVGYPISLSIHSDKIAELKTISAALVDENGDNVPFYLVDSSRETNRKCHVFLIPVTPFAAGKTYTATVNAVLLKTDGSTSPLSRTWSFTTRNELAVRNINLITLGNREYVQVVTKNGDLPDLNYTVSKNGYKILSYIGQERQYYSYGSAQLENGEYSLEISSASFAQPLHYTVMLSGSGKERKVKIIR